jgi:hypothetical protein
MTILFEAPLLVETVDNCCGPGIEDYESHLRYGAIQLPGLEKMVIGILGVSHWRPGAAG